MPGGTSAIQRAQALWTAAETAYKNGDKAAAYQNLGRMAAVLIDLHAPRFVLHQNANPGMSSLEYWASGPPANPGANTRAFTGAGQTVIENAAALPLKPAGCAWDYAVEPYDRQTPLLRLFLQGAETGDNFDHESANGETQAGAARGYSFTLADQAKAIVNVFAWQPLAGKRILALGTDWGPIASSAPKRIVLKKSTYDDLVAHGYTYLEVAYAYPYSEYHFFPANAADLVPAISDADAQAQAGVLFPSAIRLTASLYKLFWETMNFKPKLLSVEDALDGSTILEWESGAIEPPRFLGFAMDMYTYQWVLGGLDGSMWHAYPGNWRFGGLPLNYTGAYLVWISSQYADGGWFVCDNPAAYIQYSGAPHAPLNLTASDVGAGKARIRWAPDIYGVWHYQIIGYRDGVGWAQTLGPEPALDYWHFMAYGGAQFAEGRIDLRVPANGKYYFFLRAVGWRPPYPAGDYAVVEVDIASR